jgi:hypothetical protein
MPVKRNSAAKEAVMTHIGELKTSVEEEIEKSKKNSVPVSRFLSSLKKSLEALEKETRRALNIKNPNARKGSSSAFDQPIEVKPELAEFLGLEEGQEVTRQDVMTAFSVYIFLDPTKEMTPLKEKWAWLNPEGRDLRVPGQGIKPDPTLSKLLKIKEFQKSVEAGKEHVMRKSANGKGKEEVTLTDTKITNQIITKLFNRLILPSKTSKKVAKKSDEDEEEEEPVKTKAKKTLKKSEDEEEEEPVKTKAKPKAKKTLKKKSEDDEDEEEEEEEPVKTKAKPKAKKTLKKKSEDDEE